MAEWFKMPTKLLRDPRMKRLARALGGKSTVHTARGLVLSLLAYCTETENSYINTLDDIDLADLLEWTGDPGQLRQALVSSQFLSPDGTCVLDWQELCGDPLERSRNQRKNAAAARWDKERAEKQAAGLSGPNPEDQTKTKKEEKEEEREESREGRIATACEPHAVRMRPASAPPPTSSSFSFFPWEDWSQVPPDIREPNEKLYDAAWLKMTFSEIRGLLLRFQPDWVGKIPSIKAAESAWCDVLRSKLESAIKKAREANNHAIYRADRNEADGAWS